jgi:acetolactate synthase-1/2/3 large subunit
MAKIRVADYIAQRCAEQGARHVFLVTGGGAMHLNDAFARNKNLDVVCCHHEQACAMAAESYYRSTNKLAVLNVTTGPGGINALNGVYGAYVDSCAMIVVSGQVKNETHMVHYDNPVRQLGDQEVDIVSMAKPVVKYAKLLDNPAETRKILDQALYLATHGRPGPVWIDVPVDISSTLINPEELESWNNEFESVDQAVTRNTKLEIFDTLPNTYKKDVKYILQRLKTSKSPVLFAGAGVRLSGNYENFLALSERLGIPTVTGWNAHDTLPNDHPCYSGRPGTVGDRAGNFTVQNADLLIVLGSRLNIRQVSYNHKNFASRAFKIHVDIDQAELDKPTLHTDYKVRADLKTFIPELLSELQDYRPNPDHKKYLVWCQQKVKKYPVTLPEYQHGSFLNPYKFVDDFSKDLEPGDITVTANGSACVIPFQTSVIKKNQRLYTNSGDASMGYELPAAVGAAFANPKQRIVCIAGDGSIMMNLQELQTIQGYNLPIKIILLNNNGYLSIKQTQENYFSDNVFGTSPANGVSLPDFTKLAQAFDLNAVDIYTWQDWLHYRFLMNSPNPVLFNVHVDPKQVFSPKLAAKKLADGTMLAPSLEIMSPFLSDQEMQENQYQL